MTAPFQGSPKVVKGSDDKGDGDRQDDDQSHPAFSVSVGLHIVH
jgi:hypothetical protein